MSSTPIPPRIFQIAETSFVIGLTKEDVPSGIMGAKIEIDCDDLVAILFGDGFTTNAMMDAEELVRSRIDREAVDYAEGKPLTNDEAETVSDAFDGQFVVGWAVTFRDPKDALAFKLRYSDSITKDF